jgi:hypothetical protein
MKDLTKEIVIRSIKLLDIGYAASVYILTAILLITIINKIAGEPNEMEEEKKTTGKLILDVILRIWVIGILAYIVRNLFHLIPFPLEGVYGYEHMKVGEVTSSTVFVAFMVTFDNQLHTKIEILKKRFSKMY